MGDHKFQVYIGDIPERTRREDLEDLFRGCPCTKSFFIRDHFAFANFESLEDAEEAVRIAKDRSLFGYRIKIEVARKNIYEQDKYLPRARSPRRSFYQSRTICTLEVENLSSRTSWQNLKDVISTCRQPLYVTAHIEEKHKGTLEFRTAEDMHAVLKKFQNYELDGRKIHLVSSNPSLQIPPLPVPSKSLESKLIKRSHSVSRPNYHRSRSSKRRTRSKNLSRSPEITSTTIRDKADEEIKQSGVLVKENQVVKDQSPFRLLEKPLIHREKSSIEERSIRSRSKFPQSRSRSRRSRSWSRQSRSRSRRPRSRSRRSRSKLRRSRSRVVRSSSKQSCHRHNRSPTELRTLQRSRSRSMGEYSTLPPSEEGHSPTKELNGRTPTKELNGRTPTKELNGRTPTKESNERSSTKERDVHTPTKERDCYTPTKEHNRRSLTKERNTRSPTKESHERASKEDRHRSKSKTRSSLNTSRRVYYFLGDSRSRSRSSSTSSSAEFDENASEKQSKETKEIVRILYPNSSPRSQSQERKRLRCRRIYYLASSISENKIKSKSKSKKHSSRAQTPLANENKSEDSATLDRIKKSRPEVNPCDPRFKSGRYCSTNEWINCPPNSPLSHQSLEKEKQRTETVDMVAVSPKTSYERRSRSVSRSKSRSKSRARFDRFRSQSRGHVSRERNCDQERQSKERKLDKDAKFLIDPSTKKPIQRKFKVNLSGTD